MISRLFLLNNETFPFFREETTSPTPQVYSPLRMWYGNMVRDGTCMAEFMAKNMCLPQFPMYCPFLNFNVWINWTAEIWRSCHKELEIGWLSCSLVGHLCGNVGVVRMMILLRGSENERGRCESKLWMSFLTIFYLNVWWKLVNLHWVWVMAIVVCMACNKFLFGWLWVEGKCNYLRRRVLFVMW